MRQLLKTPGGPDCPPPREEKRLYSFPRHKSALQGTQHHFCLETQPPTTNPSLFPIIIRSVLEGKRREASSQPREHLWMAKAPLCRWERRFGGPPAPPGLPGHEAEQDRKPKCQLGSAGSHRE